MYRKKSEEELKEMYSAIGVDYSKFTDYGDMNVIVCAFGKDEDEENKYKMYPTIYMPRKESTFEGEYDLSNEDDKNNYIADCENAIERFKVWVYLMQKHVDEVKTQGYPTTSVYYPELDEYTRN